jgi:hypothetical protein
VDDHHYDFFMSRIAPVTLALALIGGVASAPRAAEYYSWIDPSGVLVMTDDPNRIPSPTQRSTVEIHRFQDPSPGLSGPATNAGASAGAPETQAPEPPPDLPSVVVGMPDDPVRSQYVWVPLGQPLPIGSEFVSGFWWHPGISSPIDAFKAFLRQHQLAAGLLPAATGAPRATLPPPALSRSPNPTYDQVLRERQALIERTFPPSAPPSKPRPIPHGGAGVRQSAAH